MHYCPRAAFVAGVLSLLLAGPAHAGWGKPQTLSQATDGMAAAANAKGNLVVAWDSFEGIRVVTARGDGALSRPQLIPNSLIAVGRDRVAVENIELEMNARGDAVVAWEADTLEIDDERVQCCRVVRASTRLAGQPFRRAQTVSPASSEGAKAAISPKGHVVVGWQRCHIEASFARAGRPFRRLRTVVRGCSNDGPASVTIDSRGTARVTYLQYPRRGRTAIRSLAVRGGKVRSRTVSRRRDPGGSAFSSFREGLAELAVIADYRAPVLVAHRSDRGRLGRFRILAERSRFEHVSLGADGGSVFAVTGKRSERLRLIERSADGLLSSPRRVPGARYVDQARTALDRSGRVGVAWLTDTKVRVTLGRFGERLGVPTTFSKRSERAGNCFPLENTCVELAFAGSGRALLVWRDRSRLRLVRYRTGARAQG